MAAKKRAAIRAHNIVNPVAPNSTGRQRWSSTVVGIVVSGGDRRSAEAAHGGERGRRVLESVAHSDGLSASLESFSPRRFKAGWIVLPVGARRRCEGRKLIGGFSGSRIRASGAGREAKIRKGLASLVYALATVQWSVGGGRSGGITQGGVEGERKEEGPNRQKEVAASRVTSSSPLPAVAHHWRQAQAMAMGDCPISPDNAEFPNLALIVGHSSKDLLEFDPKCPLLSSSVFKTPLMDHDFAVSQSSSFILWASSCNELEDTAALQSRVL
ncbi:hypothetical protein SCUP515_08064 [Seiridium cupressi]